MIKKLLAATCLGAVAMATPATAQDLTVGFMATLTGPAAGLGVHMRDGFLLGVEHAGGSLGGLETEVIVVDDELKPDLAVERANELIERDEIDIFAGVVFSNVMMAVFRPVTEAEIFLVSGNAGPSPIAGRRCSPYFFSTSWQNDQNHEVMGAWAEAQGYERVFLMAPNYQAGRDSLTGFQRHFTGEVVDEVYTQLGQLDFSAELARIAAARPDAVFTFMPGGMGVSLVRQFDQAGLKDSVVFLSAFTVDGTTLPATQAAALGLYSASQWTMDLDNAANTRFVEDFVATYDYLPSLYASQGYDAAMLIDSAIRAVGGDLSDKDALRAAFQAADFDSVRGDFAFNTNGFPIQDFYVTQAVQRDDGAIVMQSIDVAFEDFGDAYAADCRL